MPHELRGFADLPHEALTTILVLSAGFAIVVLCGVAYLTWRAKKGKDSGKPNSKGVRKPPRPRRRR